MEELSLSNQYGAVVRAPTLRDALTVAFRHRRLMVLSFLGILSGAILAALLQPNRYDAEMKILVKEGRVDTVAEASAQPQFAPPVTDEELNSEVELLRSRDLLEKIVVTSHLQSDSLWSRALAAMRVHTADRNPSEKDARTARAVLALEKDLKVEVVKRTNLIAVNYESPDPRLAARVLTELANLYLEKHVAVHRPPGALDFFQQGVQQYRKGLTEAQARLVDFTHGAAVVSAGVEKEAALQKVAEFSATLKQTEAAIAETQQRVHILQEQVASTPTRMITAVRNSDDAVLLSQLRANLLTLELKRTELLEKFDPHYRPVQEVEAQIAQTRAALVSAEKTQLHEETTDRDPAHEWIREELEKANADLAGLQARAKATAMAVRSYQENARSLQQKEIVQDDLIRTVKAAEESYLLYVRKQEEERMSDALDRGRILNVVVAEAATVPSLPSNHSSMTLLMGLLLAIFTSVGMAFVSDRLDPTFRTPDELSSFLNIPVLASMPHDGESGTITHVP
jgi:uncharacterized protein involved in exopolysaccharide biosynthesis